MLKFKKNDKIYVKQKSNLISLVDGSILFELDTGEELIFIDKLDSFYFRVQYGNYIGKVSKFRFSSKDYSKEMKGKESKKLSKLIERDVNPEEHRSSSAGRG